MPKTKNSRRHTIALQGHRIAMLEARVLREAKRADANLRDAERAKGTLERYRATTENLLLWMGDKLKEVQAPAMGTSP